MPERLFLAQVADQPPQVSPPAATTVPIPAARAAEHEGRNFFLLALHQVLLRVGWIFKTESIVMPAFLDFIGGGPVLRGCLPIFQRVGFSVPPLIYARRLKLMPQKKWSVLGTTLAMAAPFAVLSALSFTGAWRDNAGHAAPWMPLLFLVIYALFFCLTGMNQLGAQTLQGKLVRPDLRGRLFTLSVLVGAPLAIAAAAWLMPGWLALGGVGFGWIFAAVALVFVVAAAVLAPAVEPADNFKEHSTNLWQKFHAAWRAIRSSGDAQSAGILAALMSVNFMLFPHYQAIAREQFGLGLGAMMMWVCIQNGATAVVSLVAGPMADRLGNKAALHFAVLGLSVAPAAVLVLLAAPTDIAARWFWVVFAPIGFTPVSVRLLFNYALEISPAEDHPKFVSAIGMCLAMPVIVGSPTVGWLLGVAGSGWVFAGGLVLLLTAGAQTLRLSEPRRR